MSTSGTPPLRRLASVALFGLIVPNGLFVHAVLLERPGWRALLGNHLALGFALDALLALGVVACWLARSVGRTRATLFIALSLTGGLGFSLPLLWWWTGRAGSYPHDRRP